MDLHKTNVLESTSAGIHYHINHPAHSMAHAPQMSRCKSPQFNLQQNSTIMLILNNFHNKNKFQVAKKLADKNHEIHSFKYTEEDGTIREEPVPIRPDTPVSHRIGGVSGRIGLCHG